MLNNDFEEVDFYRIDGFEKAKSKALDILARRRYTKKELFEKLLKYEFDTDAAEAVVQWAQMYGFIDDLEYAKSYISDSVKLKKKGMVKIRYELYLKGVDKSVTDEAYEQIKDETDTIENLRILAKSRLSKSHDRKEIERTIRFLASRGYEFSDIKRVINEYTEEIEFEEY